MKTQAEIFAQGLAQLGCTELAPLTRFRVFEHPAKPGTRYFLGRAGALRYGATLRDSIPALTLKRTLLRKAQDVVL